MIDTLELYNELESFEVIGVDVLLLKSPVYMKTDGPQARRTFNEEEREIGSHGQPYQYKNCRGND